MNFKQLNESFKSFGITEDADEFNNLDNEYNLPLNDVEQFEKFYATYESIEDFTNDFASDLAYDATLISPAQPAVPYLSNGDPGYPAEAAEIEVPDFNYEEFCNDAFNDWITELLNDDEVSTPELINDIEKYKPTLKEIFDSQVKPSEDYIYNVAETKAYDLYDNGHFDEDPYWD